MIKTTALTLIYAAALMVGAATYLPSQASAKKTTIAANDVQRGSTVQQAFVYQVADDVLETIRNTKGTDAVTALHPVFNRYVDIEWVGKFVLGRHWRSATKQQRKAFMDSYRQFMIGSYSGRLKDYSGQNYNVEAPRDLGKGRYVLKMNVQREAGAPVTIDYKIRESGGTFKIYDLIVEGISLITTQRSEFDSVVNRKGLEFLIHALEKKAAQ